MRSPGFACGERVESHVGRLRVARPPDTEQERGQPGPAHQPTVQAPHVRLHRQGTAVPGPCMAEVLSVTHVRVLTVCYPPMGTGRKADVFPAAVQVAAKGHNGHGSS